MKTMKFSKTHVIVLIVLAIALVIGLFDWDKLAFKRPFRLGLDLQGGTQLVYQADLNNVQDRGEAMDGLRDVIERRVNLFGVAEPVVQIAKKDRLIVELAGIKDVSQAIRMIGETPYLEFREPQIKDDEIEFIPTLLTGKQLKGAQVGFDNITNKPVVNLQFDAEGKEIFADITTRNVGRPVAIYLDGLPISIPTVQEPIRDGRALITGDFTLAEVKELVQRLNAGALPVPIKLISQQSIGASLGEESLTKSLWAGLIGLGLIGLFMLIYYRLFGLAAIVALLIYIIILLALFKLIPITLTLAGIAGFILSMGMAVDANVLVFERIKEEIKLGKSFGGSIDQGFKRAWPSIRDGNISTLLTCLVLYSFTTGLVKGFAITLGLGILVSMFSALVITKLFLKIYILHHR